MPSTERPTYVDLPDEVRTAAVAVVHEVLFVEDDEDGPIFRWHETARLVHDDDSLLKCAADVVVNTLVAHPEVLAQLLDAARNQPKAPR